MQIVIGADDFRELSPDTQKELLQKFAGSEWTQRLGKDEELNAASSRLVDLAVDQVGRLIEALPAEQRRSLQLFAERGGRVRMTDLLAVTGDTERRSVSRFQCALTQKLRAVLGEEAADAQLIGWDPNSTQWDERHASIVDGVYYVSSTTARSLRSFFPCL